MADRRPLADRLADYAASLEYEDLDPRTVSLVKDRIVDSLAGAYAGLDADPVQATITYATRRRGDRTASLIGGGTATVEAAALATGVAVRYLDWNDTYVSVEPAHPSDNLGAVLSVADAYDRSGRETLLATALAYELQCRLCDAASLRTHGFDHVNYGLVSATLAAARLMGLTRAEMVQAVNIALNSHVALRQARAGELSAWKGMAFGNVGRNAVVAAELACEGIDGPAPIFEGTFGFFNQITGTFDVDVDSFGGRDGEFRIQETLVKPYPIEYNAQAAVACVFALLAEHDIEVDEIERIENETHEAGVSIIADEEEKWRPRTRETADHSMPYCIARAFLDGEMTLAQFSRDKYTDPEVIDLMDQIEVAENEAFTDRYGESVPHRMIVHTRGGTYEHEVEHPRGHHSNPLSEEELEGKFRSGCDGVLDGAEQDAILAAVDALDEGGRVSALTELL